MGSLQRNPVIPAVRGADSALRTALAGTHAAVFVLGGDIFRVLERVKAAGRRPPVCINVDLVGGVSADARAGCGSSSADRGCDLPAPARNRASQGDGPPHRSLPLRHGLRRRRAGGEADPARTISLRRNPPALAYPKVAPAYPELLKRPVLAGGLLKSLEAISFILAAGATGVSTSHQKLWRAP